MPLASTSHVTNRTNASRDMRSVSLRPHHSPKAIAGSRHSANSSNGTAALFIYNLETGALIKKIQTGVGSAVQDHADSNGLLAPVGWDADGNGMLDYVYAGDMLGNVWKFDISSSNTAQWGNKISGSAPLFATSGQPVTGGISIGIDPLT